LPSRTARLARPRTSVRPRALPAPGHHQRVPGQHRLRLGASVQRCIALREPPHSYGASAACDVCCRRARACRLTRD
jgi:hypothetical protein